MVGGRKGGPGPAGPSRWPAAHRSPRLAGVSERYPLPVYYDFASTICYVAHRVLGRLAARIDDLGVDLEWRPVDLTGLTGWRRGARVSGPGRENALRVASELGVPVRMPGFWLDSRPAHAIGLGLAEDRVKEEVWRERVWSAVFEENRDVGADGTIEILAREVGVAPEVAAPPAALETATGRAREAGIEAVPAFLIDTWPMGGIQDDQSMTAFFERYVRKRRREKGLE